MVSYIFNHTKNSEKEILQSGIYFISHTKTDRCRYVGSTGDSFYSRWRGHINALKNPKAKSNRMLKNIYKKYGIEGFRFEILQFVSTKEALPEEELYYIHALDTYHNGCNFSLDTNQPLNEKTPIEFTNELREKYLLSSPNRKTVYLYTLEGDLITTFRSSCECDRFFHIRKGRTSETINSGGQKTINRQFVPKHELINKEDWVFQYGITTEARQKVGEGLRGRVIDKEWRDKIRENRSDRIEVQLFDLDGTFFKSFLSLNECDDFLELTRGTTSKVLKGKNGAKTLRRKYIPKITS